MNYLMFRTNEGRTYAKYNTATKKAVTVSKLNKCTSVNEVDNFEPPHNATSITDYEYGEQLAKSLMHIQKVRQSL